MDDHNAYSTEIHDESFNSVVLELPEIPSNVVQPEIPCLNPSSNDNATLTSNLTVSPIFNFLRRDTYINPSPLELPVAQQRNATTAEYKFVLKDVLTADNRTRAIMTKKIPNKEFIFEDERKAVAKVVVENIFQHNGLHPSRCVLESIAKDLVYQFPALGVPSEETLGSEIWYYVPVGSCKAAGYLFDRIQNQRKELLKKRIVENQCKQVEHSGWTSDEECCENGDEAELLYMKSNMTANDISGRMKTTVFQRRSIIRENNFQNIKEKMPRLFDIIGMLVQGFDVRHANLALNLYCNWPCISKQLVAYATTESPNILKTLDILIPQQDWSEDQYCCVGFYLLPFLLKHNGMTFQIPPSSVETNISKGRKRTQTTTFQSSKRVAGEKQLPVLRRSSVRHNASALLRFISPNIAISQILAEKPVHHPQVIIRGSIQDLSLLQAFVIVQDVAIPCEQSFLQAIDTCFKSFFVLGYAFPPETKCCWQFIQYSAFKKSMGREKIPAGVRALLGQLLINSGNQNG